MTKRYHMCIDIRGLLEHRLGKKSLKGFFTKEDGTDCTDREARDYLYDCLSKGWKKIPMGECDNFDYETGCKGHP